MDKKETETDQDTDEEQWEISTFISDSADYDVLYLNEDIAVEKTSEGMTPLFPEGNGWSGEHMELQDCDIQLMWAARVIARTEFTLLAPRKMVNELEGRSYIDIRCACFLSKGGVCSLRMDHQVVAYEDDRLNSIGRNTEARVPVALDETIAFLDSVLGIPGRVRASVAWFGGVKNADAVDDFFTLKDDGGTVVWQVRDDRRFTLL